LHNIFLKTLHYCSDIDGEAGARVHHRPPLPRAGQRPTQARAHSPLGFTASRIGEILNMAILNVWKLCLHCMEINNISLK